MNNDAVIREILRMQAWEHAKSELRSMLHTYYDERKRYEPIKELVGAFIKSVDDKL